jgi:hypothetical protein
MGMGGGIMVIDAKRPLLVYIVRIENDQKLPFEHKLVDFKCVNSVVYVSGRWPAPFPLSKPPIPDVSRLSKDEIKSST